MEGAQLTWRRTTTAVLLGFLPLALLIPGAFALLCHSYTSIQLLSRGQMNSEVSLGPSVFSNCSTGQNLCVEVQLMLSTEKTTILAVHRDCASEGLEEEAGPTTSHNEALAIYSNVRYCGSDRCNSELGDFNVSRVAKQDNAAANSSNRCYSGLSLSSEPGILDRVTCRGGYSQCYHGKGTIIAGHLGVGFHIKTCQDPSCSVPQRQSFGPLELTLQGSCCRGNFCNGKMVASQVQTHSTAAPAWTTTRREEDTSALPTDSHKPDIKNDTQNTFAVSEEVTVPPDYESDSNMGTTTFHNPIYDYEESEDDGVQLPVGTNVTLNPRAANLVPPKPRLPFYVLLVALGIVVLRIW